MTEAERLQGVADKILSGREYQFRRTPAPFRGILQTLGRWLKPVFDAVERFFDVIWGNPASQIATAAVLLILFVLVARTVASRRRVQAVSRSFGRASGRAEDPAALDAAAEAAEQRGAFDLALRLRFRAGLIRLERAGRITAVDRRPTGALAEAIGSPPLARLGERFDAVAYGHEEATVDDIDTARSTFAELLRDPA